MRTKIKIGAMATLAGLSCATFASAAKDKWDGPTDDAGEFVSIKVKENKRGAPKKIVSFTIDQGGEGTCGKFKLEPRKPRKLDKDRMFKLRLKSRGQTWFVVRGGVVARDVMRGTYEQIGCGGATDPWFAHNED